MSTTRSNYWKVLAFAFGFAAAMTGAWLVSVLSIGPAALTSAIDGIFSVANVGGDFLAQQIQAYMSLEPLLLATSSWDGGESLRFAGSAWTSYAATVFAGALVQGLSCAVLGLVVARWLARRRPAATEE